jgi:hypothetical protein
VFSCYKTQGLSFTPTYTYPFGCKNKIIERKTAMASICEPLPDIVPFKIDEENQIYYFDADVAPTWDLSWEITIYAQKHVPGMKSLSHHKIEAEHMFLAPYSKETLKKFKKPTYVHMHL